MSEPGLAARRAALNLLDDVLTRHRSLDAMFVQQTSGLEGRDRAFTRLLVATTLRHLGRIDALIDSAMERPLRDEAQTVRHVLRLGVAQLLWLDTPAHAAVSQAVAMLPVKRAAFKGLVNAVLRRVAREGRALLDRLDSRLDLPHWLAQSWRIDWGAERADALIAAHAREAPLDLTIPYDLDLWRDHFAAADLEPHLLPCGSLRLLKAHGPVESWPGYNDGAWWVQEAAASLPARLLADRIPGRIVDLCAAPGGKTAQLMHQGAHVTALDIHPQRLAIMAANMERLRLAPQMIEADAREWTADAPFDGVLLDAPCSATGTIRRHPDLPWLKRPQDIAPLVELQRRLLANAARMLRAGGLLVFATCSLQKAEGEAQRDWALSQNLGLTLRALDPVALGLPSGTSDGQGGLRIFPGDSVTDTPINGDASFGSGFFIAVFEKS